MNFLKNRIAIAEVLGVKLYIRPVCGTPQGGVLSSRIWNLAFDPLLKLLNSNSPCAPVHYVTDSHSCQNKGASGPCSSSYLYFRPEQTRECCQSFATAVSLTNNLTPVNSQTKCCF